VGHADGCRAAQQLLGESRWDLLILGNFMPDGKGVAFLPIVRRDFSTAKVLVTSAWAEMQNALDVIRAGARGFLMKRLLSSREMQIFFKLAVGMKTSVICLSPRST
jgi:response regulator of citrate/malate metabolism